MVIWGQDLVYDQFTVEDGLPSSQVYECFEDDQGYLWLLTDKGIARYNGYAFQTYSKKDGLTDNVFYEYYIGQDSTIWLLGANNTVTGIRTNPLQFINYKYNQKLQEQSKNIPSQFLIDENQNLYVSYLANFGYVKIDASGKVENKLNWFGAAEKRDQISAEIRQVDSAFSYLVMTNKNNTKALALSNYVLVFKQPTATSVIGISEKKQIKIITDNEIIDISTKMRPIGLGCFSDTTFWVSFAGDGLIEYNYKGQEKRHLLKNKTVSDFFVDREGNYWISTLNSGVFHSRNSHIKRINLPKGFTSSINCLSKNEKGNLFFTTFEGKVGMVQLDSVNLIFESDLFEKVLLTYSEFHEDVFFSHQNSISNVAKEVVYYTSMSSGGYDLVAYNKNFYSCSYWGFREVFETGEIKTYRFNFKPRSIAVSDELIYLGTTEGVWKRTLNDTIENFTCLDTSRKDYYRDLVCWRDFLFAANYGVGIDIYRKGKFWHRIPGVDLVSGFINKLYLDDHENLWLCTDNGINKIEFNLAEKSYKIKKLDFEDGIISNEVNDIVVVDSTVWLATRSGICYFNEDQVFEKKNEQAKYHLGINSFAVNDVIQDVTTQKFNYDENRVSFQFSGISFKTNSPLRYRYKLEGAKGGWNYTRNTEAVFPNLSPGKYQFVVQTKGENESWANEEARLQFEISPPYWQTWWFYTLISGTIALLIYLFFRYRILLYNGDLLREILRQLMKKIKGETGYIIVKESGNDVKILSSSIFYVKSDGNYIEIHHEKGKTVIREKIGNFLGLVPDPLEYLRVRRSFIVRIDQVDEKGKKELVIKGETIQVGKTYLEELEKIQL